MAMTSKIKKLIGDFKLCVNFPLCVCVCVRVCVLFKVHSQYPFHIFLHSVHCASYNIESVD
jgi:hypothetical protein